MLKEKLKKLDKRHIICGTLTAAFLLYGILFMHHALLRAIDSIRDLVLSIAFYFTEFFELHIITPTVINVPDASKIGLPETAEGFFNKLSEFGRLLIDSDNLKEYWGGALRFLADAIPIVVILLPFVFLFVVAFRRALKRENNDHGAESKPLRLAKMIAGKTYIPAKKQLVKFIDFLRENKIFLKIWFLIWFVNMNVVTIILEATAYVFYILGSISFNGFYGQFQKLIMDLSLMLRSMPWAVWLVIGYILFDRWRVKFALRRLRNFEKQNRETVNSFGSVALLFKGTMGAGKTLVITDMNMTQTEIFRDEALNVMYETDLKFPDFPWMKFEIALKEAIEKHEIFNLATCKTFVEKVAAVFSVTRSQEQISGYDFDRYGLEYDNKLKLISLFEALEIYAKVYFIYKSATLAVANYSIREDDELNDEGNFPLWNKEGDAFDRDSRKISEKSRYAHILDFDMLRPGETVIEDNELADAFEFGIVNITEVGKERGNQYDTKGLKRTDDDANRVNDLFNLMLKMARHSATIDNKRFVRYFMDDQRDQSLGADARELCDVVNIVDKSKVKLAMPHFLSNLLYDIFVPKFKDFYYDFRYARGDNTLFVHTCKKITSWIYSRHTKIYNRFGYSTRTLKVDGGGKHKYYLMAKKIFSERFASDAFSEFFYVKALRSAKGLNDIPTYAGVRATFEEFSQQNSYFMKDLGKNFIKEILLLAAHKDTEETKTTEEEQLTALREQCLYIAFYELTKAVEEKRAKAKAEKKQGQKISAIPSPTEEQIEKRTEELLKEKCKTLGIPLSA